MSTAEERGEPSSAALGAVAFQDHLVRSLDLSLSYPRVPPGGRRSTAGKDAKYRKNIRTAKAVIDSGRGAPNARIGERTAEYEYVLDPEPKPLSLAQKFGLVDAPAQPLSDGDWTDLKLKSNRRDDSSLPCVICKDTFGLQPQVLLSCSHVFHKVKQKETLIRVLQSGIPYQGLDPKTFRSNPDSCIVPLTRCGWDNSVCFLDTLCTKNCLAAFERFTGRKSCPMCRRQEYQTRVIYEGAKICRLRSAIRIQAAWRGYVVRRWYRRLRETVPPKEPLLRKRYYEGKLSAITERMVNSCSTGVSDFLLEIEQSVQASRAVFRSLDSSKLRMVSEDDWQHIYEKVRARDDIDCPICIMPLERNSRASGVVPPTHPEEEAPRGHGGCVLLSCTHVFHRTCLEAFEQLSLLEEKMCPVCRSSYQKRYV